VSKDGQFSADDFSFELEAILVNAEFALDDFLGHGQLRLRTLGFLTAFGHLDSEFAELLFQVGEGERSLGRCGNILRKSGDSLSGNLFGAGIAAMNRFPQSDNPGCIEFVGKVDFSDWHIRAS